MKRHFRGWFLVLVSPLFFFATMLRADGIVDIKHPGNTIFVIANPGHYRLVSDVTMTVGIPAFQIDVNDVTLDLNGHTVTGIPGPGSGVGYLGTGRRIKILNGAIRNFQNYGIVIGNDCTVENVSISGCGLTGLFGGNNLRVVNCEIASHGDDGIQVGTGAYIANCRVSGNTKYGIRVGNGSIVEACTLADNGLAGGYAGIYTGAAAIIRQNTILGSGTITGIITGISAGARTRVEGNVVSSLNATGNATGIITGANAHVIDNSVSNADGLNAFGIVTGDASMVEGNTVMDCDGINLAVGIDVPSRCTIRNNTSSENDVTSSGDAYGIRSGQDCIIEGNLCYHNSEGNSGNGTGYGIYTTAGSTVRGNTVRTNGAQGTDGSAVGILTNNICVVESNTVIGNTSLGTGTATGILSPSNCRIFNNHVSSNTGGSNDTGIRVSGGGNVVSGNTTTGHDANLGVHLDGTGSFAELNRCLEGFTVDAGNAEGTGDHVNVNF